MVSRKENYQYTQCGLNSVFLRGIEVFHCECGVVVPVIPFSANLHRLIVIDILKKGTLLSPEEIRFLRKMANFSSVELAKFMGVSPVSVSRWENSAAKIGVANDRVLRLICFVGMLQHILNSKDKNAIHAVAAHAKEISAFNIRMFLEKIEDKDEGSAHVTIDPSALVDYNSTVDLQADQNPQVH